MLKVTIVLCVVLFVSVTYGSIWWDNLETAYSNIQKSINNANSIAMKKLDFFTDDIEKTNKDALRRLEIFGNRTLNKIENIADKLSVMLSHDAKYIDICKYIEIPNNLNDMGRALLLNMSVCITDKLKTKQINVINSISKKLKIEFNEINDTARDCYENVVDEESFTGAINCFNEAESGANLCSTNAIKKLEDTIKLSNKLLRIDRTFFDCLRINRFDDFHEKLDEAKECIVQLTMAQNKNKY